MYIVTIYIATAFNLNYEGWYSMMRCNFIRNALAIACLIILAYLSFSFLSGKLVNVESLQGTWSSLCGQYELTFTNSSFTNQTGVTSEFRLRGNSISFSESGVKYRLRVSQEHLVVGEIVFFRVHK